MRAVLQHGIRQVRLAELPEPKPGPGEVLLRTRAVTLCASDLHIYAEGNVGGVSWDRPFVPGHEVSAIIEDPNGSDFSPGAPVVMDPAVPCRSCEMCSAGSFHLCLDLKFCDLPPVDGAMRELIAWPADRVYALPSSVDIVEAPLIEPLCVAIHALELAPDLRGARVSIAGCGAIGLFTLQMARLRGAGRIFATDPIPERLAVAKELGADVTVQVGPQEAAAEILRAVKKKGMALGIRTSLVICHREAP